MRIIVLLFERNSTVFPHHSYEYVFNVFGELRGNAAEFFSNDSMACVAPRSHGGDPPRRPTGPVPAQCQGSTIRGVTINQALRTAFKDNREESLTVGFDIEDQGTFHPLGVNASYLNSLIGEQIRPLPLACEWEEIPPAYKANILPTLESYFNLAEWYNRQDKVVVDDNVFTMPDDAKAHMPPLKVWDDRTQEDWEELVDWWSHPDRMARSVQNAANQAKNTIVTHQGKKPFVQGRQEYKAKKGYYEDLIETWRKGHSKKNGQFKTEENKARYEEINAMKDHIRAGIIPFKTDQEILYEIVLSDNQQNMSGRGRKLLGGGLTSRRYANRAFGDVMSREQITQLYRQEQQEKELYKKQAEEAQAQAWLAAQKADAAQRWADQTHDILGQFFSHYNSPNSAGLFNPSTSSHVPVPDPMPLLAPQWLYLLQPPFSFNQPLQPPFPYSQPLQPLQPPYTGPIPPPYTGPIPPPYTYPIPPTLVTNNTFTNCYRPVLNSTMCVSSSSNSQKPEAERTRYTLQTNPHMNDLRTVEELARDLARDNNNESSSREEEVEESGGDYSDED
ncbi:acidic leucine-rich nuclear phosphoprotein 32 family member A [Tanacetum coccineum]